MHMYGLCSYIYMSSLFFDIAMIVSVLSGIAGGAVLAHAKMIEAKAAAATAAGKSRRK